MKVAQEREQEERPEESKPTMTRSAMRIRELGAAPQNVRVVEKDEHDSIVDSAYRVTRTQLVK